MFTEAEAIQFAQGIGLEHGDDMQIYPDEEVQPGQPLGWTVFHHEDGTWSAEPMYDERLGVENS